MGGASGTRVAVVLALCAALPVPGARALRDPLAGVSRWLDAWERQEIPRAQAHDELRARAARLESLAAGADSVTRRQLLAQAAMTYFAASVPLESDPADDPLRLQPGLSWRDYLRCARACVPPAPGGRSAPDLAGLLFPEAAFSGEVRRVGPVYGAAYWEPARDVFREASDPAVRLRAGAFAAARCLLADWDLAREISGEVYRLEAEGTARSRAEARAWADVIAEMSAAFSAALATCAQDVLAALDLMTAERGGEPSLASLADGKSLWASIAPYLHRAVRGREPDSRHPDWLDLSTNRFLTEPGLRVSAVRSVPRAGDTARLVPVIEIRLWDGYGVGSSAARPWLERRRQRLASLPEDREP